MRPRAAFRKLALKVRDKEPGEKLADTSGRRAIHLNGVVLTVELLVFYVADWWAIRRKTAT